MVGPAPAPAAADVVAAYAVEDVVAAGNALVRHDAAIDLGELLRHILLLLPLLLLLHHQPRRVSKSQMVVGSRLELFYLVIYRLRRLIAMGRRDVRRRMPWAAAAVAVVGVCILSGSGNW